MKFEKPTIQTYFLILGVIFVLFVQSKDLDISEPFKILSGIFISFPLLLLAIFAVSNIKISVKNYYQEKKDNINNLIKQLRNQQEKMTDTNKLLDLDREIIIKREELKGVQSNRFEKSSIFSIIWFIISFLIFYLKLGIYINLSSNILGLITFLIGSYYIAEMLNALFIAFKK